MLFGNIPSIVPSDALSGDLPVLPECLQAFSHAATAHSNTFSNLAGGDNWVGMGAYPIEYLSIRHSGRSPRTVVSHSCHTMTQPLGSKLIPLKESIPPKELSRCSCIVLDVMESTAFGRKNDRPRSEQPGGRPSQAMLETDNATSNTQADKHPPTKAQPFK